MTGTKINFEQSFTKIVEVELDYRLKIAGQINKFCFKEYNKLLTGVYPDVPRKKTSAMIQNLFILYFLLYSDDVTFWTDHGEFRTSFCKNSLQYKKLYEISLSRMKILWPTLWIFSELENFTDINYPDDYPFESTKSTSNWRKIENYRIIQKISTKIVFQLVFRFSFCCFSHIFVNWQKFVFWKSTESSEILPLLDILLDILL